MKTSDFFYELPKECIAQTPVYPRDSSRLMVYSRNNKSLEHKHFRDLPSFLRKGDALVVNETRVIPARLIGTKRGTQRAVEVFLLERKDIDSWHTLLRPGRKLHKGDFVDFGELSAEIIDKMDDGVALVKFYYDGVFEVILDNLGTIPLPPYITQQLEDKNRYQTVYAREDGSCAAPTAGLHFTTELMEELREMGVHIIPILLHVGLGTFRPVKTENILEHTMHSEFFSISEEAANKLNDVRASGGRIIAVGTTSVRTLESVSDENGTLRPCSGHTDIFIYPGYKFKCVDCMITNFHLPESTLLMLVSAFAGKEEVLSLYKTAILSGYRFFSFGDAMLFL